MEAAATLPSGTFPSDELTGEPVTNPSGEDLADVKAFGMSQDGRISHVLVGFGGFLGLGEKEVLLPFEAFEVGEAEDGIVLSLDMTEDEIEALPRFERRDRSVADRPVGMSGQTGMSPGTAAPADSGAARTTTN